MGRARVNLKCVSAFKECVGVEKDRANNLAYNMSAVNEVIASINGEISRLNECIRECNIALEAAQRKLSDLKGNLAYLNSRLANTPSTIIEQEWCGYDEDGNAVYREVRRSNPEYVNLQNQISRVSCNIRELECVATPLRSKISELSIFIRNYESSKSVLATYKDHVIKHCNSISSKSDRAISKLGEAENAIKNYMNEYVQIGDISDPHSIVRSPNPRSNYL